jgi:TPR repeat protein
MFGRFKGLATATALLASANATSSVAGPYEDGDRAFQRKDYASAMQTWRPLAEHGDARAQGAIASLYLNGLGVPPDAALAMQWCAKAAEQGDARAQYLLGSMYRDGSGAGKDLPRAVALLRKSADQDFPWAQYSLGLMYFVGEGVPIDYLEAYHWLTLAAAERPNDDAQVRSTAAFLLDEVSSKLTPDQVAMAKQRTRDWKPASAIGIPRQ